MNWMYVVWGCIGAFIGSVFMFMVNAFMNASHEADMESELYRKEIMIRRLAAENRQLRIKQNDQKRGNGVSLHYIDENEDKH